MTAFIPADVPPVDHLVDSRRWREFGVTHWHCTVEEIATQARDRFDAERLRTIDQGREARPVADPREALVWITEQRVKALRRAADPVTAARRAGWPTPELWAERAEVTWEVLIGGSRAPAGGGIAISEGRSVDIFAVPMTARDCSRHAEVTR